MCPLAFDTIKSVYMFINIFKTTHPKSRHNNRNNTRANTQTRKHAKPPARTQLCTQISEFVHAQIISWARKHANTKSTHIQIFLYICQTYLQNKGRQCGYCIDKDKKRLIINFVKLFEDQDVIVIIHVYAENTWLFLVQILNYSLFVRRSGRNPLARILIYI